MKTLIVLSAIPASGKSTWAEAYRTSHENVKIISSDAIRIEITGDFQDHSRQKEVWELFEKRIKEYSQIDGVTVILDALNDLNVLRQKYVKENQEYDKYILVMFDTPKDDSVYYNSLREKAVRVPDFILDSLISKFEPLDDSTSALYDEIYRYNWKENTTTRIK